jgi:hypothetical protein
MYIGLLVKCLILFSGFNDIWSFPQSFFEKYTNIKFRENPSKGGAELVRAEGRWTDRNDEVKERFSHIYELAPTAPNHQKKHEFLQKIDRL